MDWHTRTDEIQSRFFRAGPRTFLWLDYGTLSPDLLQWSFTFMDLGMCHTLTGHASANVLPSGGYLVNFKHHPTEEAALEAVFGEHYPGFVERLYKDMLADV
jgi:hypothetical protein